MKMVTNSTCLQPAPVNVKFAVLLGWAPYNETSCFYECLQRQRETVELLSISPGSDVHQPEMKKNKSKRNEKKKVFKT